MNRSPRSKATALITGGANRIGRAICLSLASQGYRIALHYYRSEQNAKKTAARIEREGGTCRLFPCDLSDEQRAGQLIPEVLKSFSSCDILINNASLFEPDKIQHQNLDLLHSHLQINFIAPYILGAQFAKCCQKGNIINLLDTHILNHETLYSSYLLSKKILKELTKMMAVEFAPRIRVNAIAPGAILPPKGFSSNYLDRLATKIPLRTKGSVDQINRCIEFLLNNPYVTGQVIFNDGGEHLG